MYFSVRFFSLILKLETTETGSKKVLISWNREFVGRFARVLKSVKIRIHIPFASCWQLIDLAHMANEYLNRCVYVASPPCFNHIRSFSWFVFSLMVVYTLTVIALVKVPSLNRWSGCKSETCLLIMYRSKNMFAVVVYAFTIVVFAITSKV